MWPTWYSESALQDAGVGIPSDAEDAAEFAQAFGPEGSVIVGGTDWSGFNSMIQTFAAYVPIDRLNELVAEGGWSTDPAAQKGAEWFVTLRDMGYWSNNTAGNTVDGANAAFQSGSNAGIDLISQFFGSVPEDLLSDIVLGGIPVPDDAIEENPVVMAGWVDGV